MKRRYAPDFEVAQRSFTATEWFQLLEWNAQLKGMKKALGLTEEEKHAVLKEFDIGMIKTEDWFPKG
jgi:hypothetical protein